MSMPRARSYARKTTKNRQTLETAGIKHLSCVISVYESCFPCKHWQTGNTKSAQPRSASPSRTRAERNRRLLQTRKIVCAHIEILRQFEDSRSRRLLFARFPNNCCWHLRATRRRNLFNRQKHDSRTESCFIVRKFRQICCRARPSACRPRRVRESRFAARLRRRLWQRSWRD